MNYIRPLDTLRTIAVTLVIISHWTVWGKNSGFHFGQVGVNIFFVISGFLITRILLQNRNKAEAESGSSAQLIRSFYIRRSLRIFPIYYLFVLVMIWLNPAGTDIANDYGYYLTYTSNFMHFIQHQWSGMLSHLWSLSVEEQFYFIWPWFMVFIRPKYVLHVVISFIAIGILSTVALYLIDPVNEFNSIFTTSCFDAFGIGALLAYVSVHPASRAAVIHKWLGPAALICFALYVASSIGWIPLWWLTRTFIAVATAYAIFFIIRNPDNAFVSKVLGWKPLVYLGKISYGLYLYHNIVPWLLGQIKLFMKEREMVIPLVNASIPPSIDAYWTLLQQVVLLLVLTWLSWTIVEKPLNNLKGRFGYTK
jgi:peptidoglycan/LPS O-acetylase OafA/YrhL